MDNIYISVTRTFFKELTEKESLKIVSDQKGKCKFCNTDINKFWKVHALSDTDHIALCTICYKSQHLEELDSEKDGSIIMIKDLNQIELIDLSRTIELVKRLDVEKFSEDIDLSIVIRSLLEEGANNSDLYYAAESSDISLISQILTNLTDEDYEKRSDGLYTMKWLPNYDSFKDEIDYLYDKIMKDEKSKYHPSKWESMFQKFNNKN